MKIVLAPMDGLTDTYAREILTAIGGFDLCVTEFLRVTDTLFPQRVFIRRFPELKPQDNQKISHTHSGIPVFLQLLGSDPQAMAENAAKAAALGSMGIDLNFGCPAKTVNKRDGGASLLKYPERIYNIVSAVRRAVPDSIPVTAKMRLGYEDQSLTMDNARAIENGGAQWITIHARTKTDGYRPPAYWEALAPVSETLNIPVIANGEIWSPEDYHLCRQRSLCDSVMLGRGAMIIPDLALQIKQDIENITEEQRQAPLNWSEIVTYLEQFYTLMKANTELKERYIAPRLKLWVKWLMPTYSQAEDIFVSLKKIKDSREAMDLILASVGKS